MNLLSLRGYNASVNVELTPDQRAFAQKAVESGRFSREEEAVQEALALWEERERRRLEIIAMIDEADASLARGEGREITEESMKALAEEVKQRVRQRIAAERAAILAVVDTTPDIVSGTPVFVGTRVPFQTLIDYLAAGRPLAEFLEDFPTVTQEQAVAALQRAKEAFLVRVRQK